MGMYDSVFFRGAAANRIRCAAGHPQEWELQTKDLDCTLSTYVVHLDADEKRLLLFQGRSYREVRESVVHEGVLHERVQSDYARAVITEQLAVYAHCRMCDPVVFERTGGAGFGGDLIGEEQVWGEWLVWVVDGVVTDVKPLKVESRDDVRARLGRTEVMVLPDDDRIAARHMQKRRERMSGLA